jgi:hypothetical protein
MALLISISAIRLYGNTIKIVPGKRYKGPFCSLSPFLHREFEKAPGKGV